MDKKTLATQPQWTPTEPAYHVLIRPSCRNNGNFGSENVEQLGTLNHSDLFDPRVNDTDK